MIQLACKNASNISDMVLNDPYVYISTGDKYASPVKRESLCMILDNGVVGFWSIPKVTNIIASGTGIISYCFVMGLPAHVPLATTPLGFTRGLREDGKWDEKVGLYGNKGGYVVYCDGHVTWFDGSKPAKFLHWNGQKYTPNIRETVPNSAWITCGHEGMETNYMSDGSLVILYHAGLGGN
jgi:prepilin-type processing-associated H-X9-DG protein